MNNSAAKTLDILELLGSAGPLSVSQISRALDIPKSSTHDILSALLDRGFAQVDGQKLYTPGLSAYRVGMAYIGKTSLYSVGHGVLSRLCSKLKQTVYLAVEDGGYVVYIDKAEQESPIRFTRNIGNRNELYRTGLGKAIMAGRPELVETLNFPLTRRTGTTLCTKQQLLAELELTRQRGYALDLGEDNELLRCIAVPVRDLEGRVAGAISCSMLSSEFEKLSPEILAADLTQAALEISHALGYTENHLY